MHINHHLDEATLVSYSAGALSQSMALVAATHISVCPQCKDRAATQEAIGGALLESVESEPVDESMLDRIMAQLDDTPVDTVSAPVRHDSEVPAPLNEYINEPLDQLEWKKIVPGVAFYDMPWEGRGVSRLLRISPGKSMLPHTHDGNELTLVLRGSFSDEMGRFGPGDVADLDDQVEHQPLVDSEEDCICLIATDAPLRFTTLFGKLVQPITGF